MIYTDVLIGGPSNRNNVYYVGFSWVEKNREIGQSRELTDTTQIWRAVAELTNNKFLVSKEAVVLRRWDSETWKFGFIKRVDKGRITTVNDLESWRFER